MNKNGISDSNSTSNVELRMWEVYRIIDGFPITVLDFANWCQINDNNSQFIKARLFYQYEINAGMITKRSKLS